MDIHVIFAENANSFLVVLIVLLYKICYRVNIFVNGYLGIDRLGSELHIVSKFLLGCYSL